VEAADLLDPCELAAAQPSGLVDSRQAEPQAFDEHALAALDEFHEPAAARECFDVSQQLTTLRDRVEVDTVVPFDV